MNNEAIMRQKEKILYDTYTTPMKAKSLVPGAAQGSIGLKCSKSAIFNGLVVSTCRAIPIS